MTDVADQTTVDEAKLEAFLGQVVSDWGAAASVLMSYVGDRLGLYRAMAGAGPLTPADLATRTGTAERYVQDWLNNQAAGGYVAYDPTTGRYELPIEQAIALAVEDSPAYVPGAFDIVASAWEAVPRVLEVFRTGEGIGWHEYDQRLFDGVARFTRPQFLHQLVGEWVPALDGVEDKLRRGATVADVGCGHGWSTIVLARAYPDSTFVGFDFHDASIVAARKAAAEAGVADRCRFEVASGTDFPGSGYDLVCLFDCLHDTGDPVGIARHIRRALDPDGTVLLVEFAAGEAPEENFNPWGRGGYGFSAVFCTAVSLSQDVGLALGNQPSEARLRDVFEEAGFTRFRRVAETPFQRILEARP
jgi:SAM-dependent methyltransferase